MYALRLSNMSLQCGFLSAKRIHRNDKIEVIRTMMYDTFLTKKNLTKLYQSEDDCASLPEFGLYRLSNHAYIPVIL